MDCQIGEMRATVFSSPIVYDENNVKRVAELLPADDGFVANQIKVTTVQIVPGLKINVPTASESVPTEWEMVSEKERGDRGQVPLSPVPLSPRLWLLQSLNQSSANSC